MTNTKHTPGIIYEGYGYIEIPDHEWWDLLEECEGVQDGDCSVKCTDKKHDKTCRRWKK